MSYRKLAAATCALLATAALVDGAAGQRAAGFIDPLPVARLKQLFPAAVAFTPRGTADPLVLLRLRSRSRGAPRASDRLCLLDDRLSSPNNSGITVTFTC